MEKFGTVEQVAVTAKDEIAWAAVNEITAYTSELKQAAEKMKQLADQIDEVTFAIHDRLAQIEGPESPFTPYSLSRSTKSHLYNAVASLAKNSSSISDTIKFLEKSITFKNLSRY